MPDRSIRQRLTGSLVMLVALAIVFASAAEMWNDHLNHLGAFPGTDVVVLLFFGYVLAVDLRYGWGAS